MNTQTDRLSLTEMDAVARLSQGLATTFMKHKLEGMQPHINFTIMNGRAYCSLRASNNGSVWFDSATRLTAHNCVSSKPDAKAGAIIAARFDATNFLAWLTEEIAETIIRYRIIRKIVKTQRGKLEDPFYPTFEETSLHIDGPADLIFNIPEKAPLV